MKIVSAEFIRSARDPSGYPREGLPEVAFAGRSNVGKSSLINVLVSRKKIARTSSRPGRTQAINFFDLDGRLCLVDLPGYGYARVPLAVKRSWGSMVETYLRKRPNLRAVVVILDIRRDPSTGDMDLLNWLNHYQISSIIILTKADKLSRSQSRTRANLISSKLKKISGERPVIFSAKTGEGKAEIWERIDQAIKAENLRGHRP